VFGLQVTINLMFTLVNLGREIDGLDESLQRAVKLRPTRPLGWISKRIDLV
jgi:hypothetical protein